MNPKTIETYVGSIWTADQFATLIEKIMDGEVPFGHPTAAQARNLRRMIVRDITLCAIPAGNA